MKQLFQFLALAATVFWLTLALSSRPTAAMTGLATLNGSQPAMMTQRMTQQTLGDDPHGLLRQGRQYYSQGQFQAALRAWEAAEQGFVRQGDAIARAMVLSNQALALQQLDRLDEAFNAISRSRDLLESEDLSGSDVDERRSRVLAQVLNTEAGLLLDRGQPEAALEIWEQAQRRYQQLGEDGHVLQTRINQAQALRSLGYYRRAQGTLEAVKAQLAERPPSRLNVVSLYQLGNALRSLGQLDEAETALRESLAIAESLESQPDMIAAWLGLANTVRLRHTPAARQAALDYYQQAAAGAESPLEWMQAQTDRLSLLLENQQIRAARELLPEIQAYLETHRESLSGGRSGLFAQLKLVRNAIALAEPTDGEIVNHHTLAHTLAEIHQRAMALGDRRVQSYTLGDLGHLYELAQQWDEAERVTKQALDLARQLPNADDVAYRWEWQLGRILKARGNSQKAIAFYEEAVKSLQAMRQDLALVNTAVQFSFQDGVEPVYRQLMALLLSTDTDQSDIDLNGDYNTKSSRLSSYRQANLEKVRDLIESLQVAELDDFFKQACLDVTPVALDEIDSKTALIYTILLDADSPEQQRLDVIVRLPNQGLKHYSTTVTRTELTTTVNQIHRALVDDPIQRRRFRTTTLLPLSQKLYSWLLEPIQTDLADSNINTLAFVLDGPLRNLPMSILHDGDGYIVEKYSLALSPGLQLIDPKPLERGAMTALIAGLSEEVTQDFPPLPEVVIEVEAIRDRIPNSQVLLNQDYTKANVQEKLQRDHYSIIHLATHGQFSSSSEQTFILTWPSEVDHNYRINVNELQDLLQIQDVSGGAIELLVLSACQTAAGDDRAALGLAGVAFRAGARSTIATLWPVSDEATRAMMTQFYQELSDPSLTRSEALRRAQNTLIDSERFAHPFFWAPYTLVGNWL
ncbi:CHAT domain-containing protein [Phormidium yuhuli AB48]|uniref:CHAT domain-containing protein n=1 Tax=Phormidium yuhuli AB48 TaxID=2940671 RepID=A0ABY5ALN1_9CYAN|nr:CHAT domain-containing protein [Phormidium yuhuli]USR89828.1 CHAT domain-containing protein [Phormidium yuhuli AB48]